MFSKFGKLARLDYLFHKTGALRGKPRGYAFVEYTGERVSARHIPLPPFPIYYDAQLGSFPPHGVRLHLCAGHAFLSLLDLLCSDSGLSPTPRRDCTDYSIDDSATDALVLALLQDAAVALEAANGKVLRGRHINVTYAHQAPPDTHAHHPALRRTLPQHQHQHQQQDSGRPTTLSLLKSAPSHTRTRYASLRQPALFFCSSVLTMLCAIGLAIRLHRWRRSWCNSLRRRRQQINLQYLHIRHSLRNLGLRNRQSRRHLHLVSSRRCHAYPSLRRRHYQRQLFCAHLHRAKVMRCSKA